MSNREDKLPTETLSTFSARGLSKWYRIDSLRSFDGCKRSYSAISSVRTKPSSRQSRCKQQRPAGDRVTIPKLAKDSRRLAAKHSSHRAPLPANDKRLPKHRTLWSET